MKLCLLSPLPPPAGGIATWTKLFLNNKVSKFNNVELVNTAAIGKRKQKDIKNPFTEILRFILIVKQLKKYIQECDVFHINSSCSKLGIIKDYYCAKIVKKHNKKVVLQFHCNIEDQLFAKIQNKYLNKILKISDLIITINNTSKLYLQEKFNHGSVIIPNFIDIVEYNNNHNYKELQNLLFVGNVTTLKGVNLIASAANKFPHLKFTFIGKVCNDFNTDNLPKNVELLGQIEHERIKKYLNDADVFIFPSYTEGFPLAVLEAMSVGLPCIASNVGAIPDMLEEQGAFYVEHNVDSICDAIDKIKDIDLRIKMGSFNFNKVIEAYNSDKVISDLFDLYKHL